MAEVNGYPVGPEFAWVGWILVIIGFFLLYCYYEVAGHKLWFPFGAVTPF